MDRVAFDELLGSTCSKREMLIITDAVCRDPKRVEELWQVAISDGRNGWRGVWALAHVSEVCPNLLLPYIGDITAMMINAKHLGLKRELLKILLQHPLPSDPSGELLDDCFSTAASGIFPVGLRMYAMEMVAKYCKIYPELIPEFTAVLEDIVAEPPSVGTKGRALKLLKQFE